MKCPVCKSSDIPILKNDINCLLSICKPNLLQDLNKKLGENK